MATKRRRVVSPFNGGPYHQDTFAPYELSQTVAVLAQAVENNESQIREVAQTSAQGIKDLASLIEKQGVQSAARHESLASAFTSSQKPNYMLWVAVISVIFVLIGAAWKITDSQTQLTMAPIAASVEVLKDQTVEMKKDITLNRQLLADQSANQKAFTEKLTEVETQFWSSDEVRNTQFAEQQRTNNIMLQIAQKKPVIDYPVYPYYFPKIARKREIQ